MAFCTSCGSSLDDDAKFCTSCGSVVAEGETYPQTPPPPPVQTHNTSTAPTSPKPPLFGVSIRIPVVPSIIGILLIVLAVLLQYTPQGKEFVATYLPKTGITSLPTSIPTTVQRAGITPSPQSFLNPNLQKQLGDGGTSDSLQKIPSTQGNVQGGKSIEPIIIDPTGSYKYSAAETVYMYMMDRLHSEYGANVKIGSPKDTNDKDGYTIGVTIDITIDGYGKETLVIVEKTDQSKLGGRTVVVAGPPNAGGTVFILEPTGNTWAIVETQESTI